MFSHFDPLDFTWFILISELCFIFLIGLIKLENGEVTIRDLLFIAVLSLIPYISTAVLICAALRLIYEFFWWAIVEVLDYFELNLDKKVF